jgi:hypothetical protein
VMVNFVIYIVVGDGWDDKVGNLIFQFNDDDLVDDVSDSDSNTDVD